MGKVIDMKQWVKDHRWDGDYPDVHDYEFDPQMTAMFDYVDECQLITHQYLINLLVDEGVLAEEYRIDDE